MIVPYITPFREFRLWLICSKSSYTCDSARAKLQLNFVTACSPHHKVQEVIREEIAQWHAVSIQTKVPE